MAIGIMLEDYVGSGCFMNYQLSYKINHLWMKHKNFPIFTIQEKFIYGQI